MNKQTAILTKKKVLPDGWRKSTPEEHGRFKAALDEQFGADRPRLKPGPKPNPTGRYVPTHIKLNPVGLAWAKRTAIKMGIGYQTVINQVLMEKVIRRLAK